MNKLNLLPRAALALALTFGVGAPTLASAQEGRDRSVEKRDRGSHQCGHKHGRRGGKHRMFAELNLTDNQKAQMKAIRESAHERRQEIRAQGRSEETRAQMKELRKETRALIRDVLTPEQRQKLDERKENWKKKREGKRGHGPRA